METLESGFNDVVIIGFDGIQTLDFVGPADAFAKANEHLGKEHHKYRLWLASVTKTRIRSSAGIEICELESLAGVPNSPHTVIIAGGGEEAIRRAIEHTDLVDWLRALSLQKCRIASVCTGAFVLGAAGLLSGRAATTHWASCRMLQEMWPDIKVNADAIYTSDHPIYTSAGVTTGIDLCLSLIESDHGASVSLAVARDLVLFMRRPGTQAQFTTTLRAQTAASTRFSNLVAEIAEDPRGDLTIPALASRTGISERSFVRRFKKETGLTPGQYVQSARVEKAKTLLETTDWPLAKVSEKSGIRSLDTLHRLFLKNLGVTPGDYRKRFGLS